MTQKYRSEFIVQQYYTVTIDESQIDTFTGFAFITLSHTPENSDWFARLHRMFHAIMANEKALHTILEYQVLCEHDSICCDGGYVQSHYDDRELSFLDILTSIAEYFTQEDREELASTMAKKVKANQEGYDSYELDELSGCFKVEASGWNIIPHSHKGGKV